MEQTNVLNKDRIIELTKDTVKTLGYSCVETKITQGKSGKTLKVIIYKTEGDVSMEDCSTVSNVLLRRLELEQADFSESFDLLVESPGVDRKMESIEELKIFQEKEVRFVIRNAANYGLKDNVIIGKSEILENEMIRIRSGEKTHEIPWKDISQAKLYFDIKKYL